MRNRRVRFHAWVVVDPNSRSDALRTPPVPTLDLLLWSTQCDTAPAFTRSVQAARALKFGGALLARSLSCGKSPRRGTLHRRTRLRPSGRVTTGVGALSAQLSRSRVHRPEELERALQVER
jgi:hypothetical protein